MPTPSSCWSWRSATPARRLPAAFAALTGLLHFWEQEPRGEHLVDLLAQAEETDSTLEALRNDALTLDGGTFATPGDAYERAKAFVDAALGRVERSSGYQRTETNAFPRSS